MSEAKERSGIFKFFYVFFSIITFPIFAVLFVLRHPLWILFILILVAGGAAYWPMSQHNIALTEVVDWYKNKYQSTKLDIAKKAIEEGKSGYVPQVVLDEMKKIEEDAKEAALPKGENYNAKVVRDQKSEDLKASIKQRGGFKKKGEEKTEEQPSLESAEVLGNETADNLPQNNEAGVLTPSAGGLSALLPVAKVDEDEAKEEAPQEETESNTEPEVDLDLGLDEEPVQDNVQTAPKEEETPKPSTDDEDEMDLF